MNDLKLDENLDLEVQDGDLMLVDPGADNLHLILSSNQGDWKSSPLTGAGLHRHTNAPISPGTRMAVERGIRIQLEADGFIVSSVKLAESNLNINTQWQGR